MKTIIVGGGACGASCAARLRRLDENAQIIILEATDEISIANCGLPYYCSNVISDREKMIVAKPAIFSDLLNIEVRFNSKVTKIILDKKTVLINDDYELEYDNLVLALGASPLKPPIEGIDNKKIFTVRTLNNADRIKEFITANNVKNAVVVGGGFIGVEMAENFIKMGLNTSIVELSNQILAPIDTDTAAFAQNEMRRNGCELILNDGVKGFGNDQIELNSGNKIDYDIAILAIGIKPETSIAKDCGLNLGIGGAIKVNEFMQTSNPNIFAGGDSVEVVDFVTKEAALIPLAGPANRQGRIIADRIAGKNSIYKGTKGSSVVKIFDLTIASVGKNEKQLKKNKTEYLKTFVWGNSHASYYPNSFPLMIKLIFSSEGKIFGAQAAGIDGVEKRIDVISSVMRMNATIQDLLDSELCYAPPYSSAKDPVNILGMNAQNILDGMFKSAFYEDLENSTLIDVRPKSAFDFKTIEGAINIPAEELRERKTELPRDKKVVLFCNKGFTSYVASRILNDFDNIYSLAGGKMLYDEIVKDKMGKLTTNDKLTKKIMNAAPIIKIDACAMQCPGPIMKLADTIKTMMDGEVLEISTTDCGFGSDIEGWCKSTNNTLLGVETRSGVFTATIQKGRQNVPLLQNCQVTNQNNAQTIVMFSNDLDKALAGMIIANGAKASGKEVVMFFTFWGINILRKPKSNPKGKTIIDKMFGLMMPKGIDKLTLSKMNMGGMGSMMMKMVMKNKNVPSLYELIENAKSSGIKIIACTMAMDIMGIKPEELIDGIEFGGVAKYISESNNANNNLFI